MRDFREARASRSRLSLRTFGGGDRLAESVETSITRCVRPEV